jgi:hypothetical protein
LPQQGSSGAWQAGVGQRQLEIGTFRDSEGKLRLVIRFPSWDDLLRLAFDEICAWIRTTLTMATFGFGMIGYFQTLEEKTGVPHGASNSIKERSSSV